MLVSLLNNRAASHLFLKNYASALKDTGSIIALCLKEKKLPPPKALYRAGQSLVALERWTEAKDVLQRGMQLKGEEKKPEWKRLLDQAELGERKVMERVERQRREKLGAQALSNALRSRGLVVLNTPNPPDNPMPVHFDPEVKPGEPPLYEPEGSTYEPPPEHCPIIFPVFLLYPEYNQSDLITHFDENTTVGDHLNAMFPSSPSHGGWIGWDEKHEYYTSNMEVYVETAGKRLLKVGKGLTLREVMARAVKVGEDGKKDGVPLRDGIIGLVVLIKGAKERAFIEDYKRKRDEGWVAQITW